MADLFVWMYKAALSEYALVTETAFTMVWEPKGWTLATPPGGTPDIYTSVQADIDAHEADLSIHTGYEVVSASISSTEQKTNNTLVVVSTLTVNFDVVTGRPLHVWAGCGGCAHTTAGQNVQGFIVDGANAIKERDIWTAGVNNAIGGVKMHERIATPGAYTRKVAFQGSSATANSAAVMISGLGHCFIVVTG